MSTSFRQEMKTRNLVYTHRHTRALYAADWNSREVRGSQKDNRRIDVGLARIGNELWALGGRTCLRSGPKPRH